jgi:hypothetical protein
MVRRLVAVLGVWAVAVSCGGSPPKSAPAGTPVPALVVRVDSVEVQQRPNGPAWDPAPAQSESGDPGCDLFASVIDTMGTTAFGPLAKVAAAAVPLLCRSATPAPKERDPSLPDLKVRLSAGGAAAYVTDVAANVDRASFRLQPFLVPIDAIPPEGLLLEVVDDDGAAGDEIIGGVHLSKADLVDAVDKPTLVRADTLAKFGIVVTRYGARARQTIAMAAKDGTADVPAESALPSSLAGEVIRVRAAGAYRVGSYFDRELDPAGYPDHVAMGWNFDYEPLKSAPHACGFFLVGDERRFATLVTPSGTAVSPVGGPLLVGINDKDISNNSGDVSFVVDRRAPTVTEWLARRCSIDCQ